MARATIINAFKQRILDNPDNTGTDSKGKRYASKNFSYTDVKGNYIAKGTTLVAIPTV